MTCSVHVVWPTEEMGLVILGYKNKQNLGRAKTAHKVRDYLENVPITKATGIFYCIENTN